VCGAKAPAPRWSLTGKALLLSSQGNARDSLDRQLTHCGPMHSRLLRRADFHLGQHITVMVGFRAAQSPKGLGPMCFPT
jgi:hypothetical protein